MSLYCPSYFDWKLVVSSWQNIKTDIEKEVLTASRILRVMENISEYIHDQQANELEEDLLERLKAFTAPTGLIQSIIQTLVKVTQFMMWI